VHVHNTFPLLSPAIFHAIGQHAARVLTLHNYRLFCPAAIPMRAGKVCTDCLDRHSVLPALWHGCYRGSRLATLPLATNVALHRHLGTWTKQIDAFIALTEFQRERMIEAGLPVERVHVKPNFYPGNPSIVSWADRQQSVVFAGRLTTEKGVLALVRAWLMWGASAPELRIIGDGGMRAELEQLAATAPEIPIRFLGQLASTAAQDEIARASLLVLPSECFEGFPMVVREAFAFGTPAAVSNIGPLPSIVRQNENGVVFEPGNPQSLLQVVCATWEKSGELEQLAMGARRSFEALYTEEANYRMLMTIYEQAMEVSRRRRDAQ
jgi:glycosyltransferase involved in cell wall biosynthesis